MLYNYLKIAIRNLWKNKLFSVINIMGLGLAIPFALLALLHLQSTFEFDNFHPDSERIYRIITNEVSPQGGTTKYASSPYLLAEQLKNNYACVEKATKVVRDFNWELNTPFKNLRVNTIYVEPTFFELFGFKLAKGSVPVEPNTLLLSQEAAERFFGDTNPIGQLLVHPTYGAFKVTGVLKHFKAQTQFKSDVMISMATYDRLHPDAIKPQAWGDYPTHTFVKLLSNAKPEALDAAVLSIAKSTNQHLVAMHKTNLFRKQALASISPSTEELRFNPYVDSMQDIYFNFGIPLMILLLAGFNYTNLTLARSLSRSKEVGVRKVMGALRFQLIFQFIGEAIIIAFLALSVGVLMLYTMKESIHVQWVTWEVDNQLAIWLIFIAFTLLLGMVAGVIPASILSKFRPVEVLKGALTPVSFGKVNFRKVLIVIQFVVTMGFIFQIGHMYNQFNYMATENENFNRKGIFNISLLDHNYQRLIDEISKNKNVEKIGLTSMPFGSFPSQQAFKAKQNDENQSTFYYAVDKNFIENMQLSFVAGQNFPVTTSDSTSRFVLINQKAVERLRLGSPKEAVGKTIFLNNTNEVQIVGVVKDFCHFHYQYKQEPLVFQFNPALFGVLTIKVNQATAPDTFLANMKAIWKKYYPYQEMGYSWFEKDLYDRYYPAEDMKMMGAASFVIFVIALMGLLGMVTYSTEKRFKEIGIRKVMGASVWEVVKILSWSFLKLLLIASTIAIPIGLLEGSFLNSVFVYNNGINLSLMMMFLLTVLLVAVMTIAYYTTKAALMNPVKSLKTE
ncbi:MAG: ABC transporter permease [Spirosomataceae bacterium]